MPSNINGSQFNQNINKVSDKIVKATSTAINKIVTDIQNVEVEEYSDFETETVDLNDGATLELKSLGFTDEDIRRLQNNEITHEQLIAEIQSDQDTTRMRKLVEASLLNGQEYNTVEDIDKAIKDLKQQNEVLSTKQKEYNESAAIIGVLDLMKNQNLTLDQALNQTYITGEQIIGDNGVLIDNSISYGEALKDSGKLETLKNCLTYNEAVPGGILGIGGSPESYTYNDSKNLSDFYNQISTNLNTSESDYANEIAKNNQKVKELEALSTYVTDETTNYVDNVLKYGLKEDFAENCGKNEKISTTLNEIKNSAVPDANSPGNYLEYYATNTETKAAIIAGLINNDPAISDSSGLYVNGVPIAANVDDTFNHYCQWYQVMTDEEKAVFNYIYNTEGAEGAYKYLESESLQKSLDIRYYQYKSKQDAKWAAEHPVEASFISVAITPAEGLGSMINSNLAILNGKQILRTDNYSTGTTYRGGVSQMVGENYGEGAQFAYDIGMSMADTAVVAAPTILSGGALSGVAMGTLTFTNMGTRVYVSSLNDALDRGLTDQEAVTEAWVYTAAETAMESISIGNLAKISGRMNSKVLNLAAKAENSIADPKKAKYASRAITIFGSGLSQATVEGEEEFATSVVDFFADNIIAGDNSTFYQTIDDYKSKGMSEDEAIAKAMQDTASDWAMSFVGGAISGGIFGGGGAAYAMNRNSRANKSSPLKTDINLGLNTGATVGNYTSAIMDDKLYLVHPAFTGKKKTYNSDVESTRNPKIDVKKMYAEYKTSPTFKPIRQGFKAMAHTASFMTTIPTSFVYTPIAKNAKMPLKVYTEGLYHLTSETAADSIISSRTVRASSHLTSYGSKKSFFFAGIPDTGNVAYNVEGLPPTAVAVKVNPKAEHLKLFDYRSLGDRAVTHRGDLDLTDMDVRKVYLGLKNVNGNLVYQEISKEEYDNYHLDLTEGQMQLVGETKKAKIKADFYGISYRTGTQLQLFSEALRTLKSSKLSENAKRTAQKFKSAIMDDKLYLIHPMFNRKKSGRKRSLSSGLNQPIMLRDALYNSADFESRLAKPKMTYNLLSRIADSVKLKDDGVYHIITTLNSRYQKNMPRPEVTQIFEGNVTDLAFKYPNYPIKNEQTGLKNVVQVDENGNPIFYHFQTTGFKTEDETGRLYLNMWDYNNAYYFTETFMAECQKRGIDFYIKVGTANDPRDETIVIYVNEQNKLNCINLCKEIRESMGYNVFDNPPIFTSVVDDFIGYGDSPANKKVSFNRQRTMWIEESYNEAVKQYISAGKSVSHQDQKFLDYFYQTLLGKASKYNIDVNNFSLNTRVKNNLHNHLDRSSEFEVANGNAKEMSGSSHASSVVIRRVPNKFIMAADEIINDTKFMEFYHKGDLRGFVGPMAQRLERLEQQILDDTGLSEAFRINDNYGLTEKVDNYSDVIIEAYDNGGWEAVEGHIPRNGETGINPRKIFEQYSAEELRIARKLYNERNTRTSISRMKMHNATGVRDVKNENTNSEIETGHDSRLRVSDEELRLRKQKIDELKASLSDMGVITPETPQSIFDALLKNLEEGIKIDPTFEKLLLNLDAIFKHSPDFYMYLQDNSFGGGYNPILDQYFLGRNLFDFGNGDGLSFTALHELGHTLFNKFKGSRQEMDLGFLGIQEFFAVMPNKRMTNIVQNAQNFMRSNHFEVIQYLSRNEESWKSVRTEAKRRFSTIREEEAQRIGQNVDEIFDSDSSYKLISMLREAGITDDRIEELMSNQEKLKEVLVKANELDMVCLLHKDIESLSEENLGRTNLEAMLNSVIQSEKYGDISFKYFHPDAYWARKDDIDGACLDSYDELMADYMAFKSFGREDLIDDLRTLAGDELVDALEEEYNEILKILDSKGLIVR